MWQSMESLIGRLLSEVYLNQIPKADSYWTWVSEWASLFWTLAMFQLSNSWGMLKPSPMSPLYQRHCHLWYMAGGCLKISQVVIIHTLSLMTIRGQDDTPMTRKECSGGVSTEWTVPSFLWFYQQVWMWKRITGSWKIHLINCNKVHATEAIRGGYWHGLFVNEKQVGNPENRHAEDKLLNGCACNAENSVGPLSHIYGSCHTLFEAYH